MDLKVRVRKRIQIRAQSRILRNSFVSFKNGKWYSKNLKTSCVITAGFFIGCHPRAKP